MRVLTRMLSCSSSSPHPWIGPRVLRNPREAMTASTSIVSRRCVVAVDDGALDLVVPSRRRNS